MNKQVVPWITGGDVNGHSSAGVTRINFITPFTHHITSLTLNYWTIENWSEIDKKLISE